MTDAHAITSVVTSSKEDQAPATEAALNFTAFEDAPEMANTAADGKQIIDMDDRALDSLDISELLNVAFASAKVEEGLVASRQGDDLLFDSFEEPAIGELNVEQDRDPVIGSLGSGFLSAAKDASTDASEGATEEQKNGDAGANDSLDFDDEFRPASEVFTEEDESLDPDSASAASLASTEPAETLKDAQANEHVAPEVEEGEQQQSNPSPVDETKAQAAFSMAREKNGAELLDGLQSVQSAPNGNYADQQIRVGLLQGLNMLGGAGLAGLAKMIHSGGTSITSHVRQRQYGKLSGQIDQITQTMDSLMVKMNANGLAAGLDGLKGDQRSEFVKEFFENPTNKGMFNELLGSFGSLATKATEAAVVGAGAGYSPEQLDAEITRRVSDIQQKHKTLLESMTDHNGVSLSDRLSNIAQSVAAAIDKLFQRASQALGLGPRPGM